ncbi:FAD:protein FMN transferase [Magnetococcales bacterium HHB-1]
MSRYLSLKNLLIPLSMLLLVACEKAPQKNKINHTHRLIMGTMVTITTWGVDEKKAPQAVKAAFERMQQIDQQMSRHNPASLVTKINKKIRGEETTLPKNLHNLLKLALDIQQKSDGAFDPTLLPLIELWGFSKEPPPTSPPPLEKITAWRTQRKTASWQLRENRVRLNTETAAFDLGGIAKGYAIDQAIETLKSHGINNAIVNAGGDLRVIGNKSGSPWRIGIRHPRKTTSEHNHPAVIATASFKKARAMVTSGDYERFFIHQKRRYHHILDPATGYPSKSGLLSVSVQASNAALADALATAFFVLGIEKGKKLLEAFPDCAVLWVDKKEQLGTFGPFM